MEKPMRFINDDGVLVYHHSFNCNKRAALDEQIRSRPFIDQHTLLPTLIYLQHSARRRVLLLVRLVVQDWPSKGLKQMAINGHRHIILWKKKYAPVTKADC